jgi:hypothetical protein
MGEEETKTNTTGQETEKQPAAPPATPPATEPAAGKPGAEGKIYTEAQLAELQAKWEEEYKANQAAEKDFAKMTPAQKAQKLLDDQKAETAKLQAQLTDRDLTDYARGELAKAELPAGALAFVKGKDTTDTDARIKEFTALLAAGVQSGVEKRFKNAGYTPRGTSAGSTDDGKAQKPRGVTINEKK